MSVLDVSLELIQEGFITFDLNFNSPFEFSVLDVIR